jgi:tetratricopeptide (TPR) repeat protein
MRQTHPGNRVKTEPLSRERAGTAVAIAFIAAAICAAYLNSLHGAFVLDDKMSIRDNPSIRRLWPPSELLNPARGTGTTVEGRPVLNISFALNYAAGGTSVLGYHLANLAIHVLASLALFGIVRRTLEKAGGTMAADAVPFACICALVWGLHPLQAESVSYVSQRAESLMGLWFLACLYAVVRSDGSRRSAAWVALAILAAFLCAGTKEIAVALPVVVLLYDRAFLAGSFRGAWRARPVLYAGLLASWLALVVVASSAGNRGGTIGRAAGVTPMQFAQCQARGIFHYLRLSIWPHPLVADYGTNFVTFPQALPWAVALLGILAAVLWATVKHSRAGFLGAWFFIILAPSSSFVGGTRQMLAEHRMYLSLAAVVLGVLLLLYRAMGRRALVLGLLWASACAAATVSRNRVFHDEFSFDQDLVRNRPQNAWARNSLGVALADRDRYREAIEQYMEALRLNPGYAEAQNNWGNALARMPGMQDEAEEKFRAALRLRPDYAEAEDNWGNLLAAQSGRQLEAAGHYEAALRMKPTFAEAENNWGNVLAALPGRREEAEQHYRAALGLDPDLALAHNNLARLLALDPETREEALAHLREAVRLQPDYAAAQNNLGLLLLGTPGMVAEAREHFEDAVRLQPQSFLFHFNLGRALAAEPGRQGEAAHQFEEALRLNPGFLPAQAELQRLSAKGQD